MPNVQTPIGQINFPDLREPKQFDNDKEPKYGFRMTVPKSGDIEPIREAIATAAKDKFPKKYAGKSNDAILASVKNPIRDGDTETRDDGEPRHEGCWFFNARSKKQPDIVDGSLNRITAESDLVYAGANCRCVLSVYGYDTSGSKGVAFGLEAIQMTGGGDRVGAAPVDGTKAFDAVDPPSVDDIDDML